MPQNREQVNRNERNYTIIDMILGLFLSVLMIDNFKGISFSLPYEGEVKDFMNWSTSLFACGVLLLMDVSFPCFLSWVVNAF